MNLVQQAEQLKSLPDQQLVQLQQQPTVVPPYIVVAEMQRRASMRKAAQGAQAMAQPQQPPVAQQLPQQMQQPQQPPMQMAGGGLANLAGYFSQLQGPADLPEVDPTMIGANDFPNYSIDTDQGFQNQRKLKINPQTPRDWQAHLKIMQQQSGESPLKALAEKYGADEEGYRNKKMGLGEILMNLGLSMAASKRPDFLGALGEGGVGALSGWRHDKDRNVALANQAATKKMQALEGLQRHNDRIQDYAIDAARAEQAKYNQERQYDMSLEAQIQNQYRNESNQRAIADRQTAAELSRDQRAMKHDEAMAGRRMDEIRLQGDQAKELAQLHAKLTPKTGGGDQDTKAIRLIGVYNAMADDLMKDAENLEKQAEEVLVRGNDPNHPTAIRKEQLKKLAADKRSQAYQVNQQRALLMVSLAERSGFSMPKPRQNDDNAPDPKRKVMTAEEFINSFPVGGGSDTSQQDKSPSVKWPRRMPELIGEAPAQADPMMRGLGALGRWMGPGRQDDRMEIPYR